MAVYLSDAQYTGPEADGDLWSAVPHVVVFLQGTAPDRPLDDQMDHSVYPALVRVPGLGDILGTMSAPGDNYQRNDERAMWRSAERS
ncbi:phage tail terminator protein [Salmonella enterica]|uniref:phage tail terminator protein n=1 Tax=Salmonella enterica TaxID=28901 RepID=UPI00398C2E5F